MSSFRDTYFYTCFFYTELGYIYINHEETILTILVFSILLILFSFLTGLLGALTGLGGGVIIIPVLVLLFHVNIHYAMGASLISVIATSSGAAIAYLRAGYTNLRIGLLLATGAVVGAFVGALLVGVVSKTFLAITFSLVMFFSAYATIKKKEDTNTATTSHPWAEKLNLRGNYPSSNAATYHVQNIPLGLSTMSIAGILSGLLGIGSGTINVLAMDQILHIPFKVATTTSNFIIGITAAVSTGIYFTHGYINPTITFPVMLGVLAGSFAGAKILPNIRSYNLRIIFSIVICIIGLQMLYKALTGNI